MFVSRIRVPRAFEPRHREGQIAGAGAGNKRHHVSMEWIRGMLAMAGKIRLAVLVMVPLAACQPSTPQALGTLEWDRIPLPATASEPILEIVVREGEDRKSVG